ncbi:winged helix-turn-helix DNA-binding domainprotein [Vibrio phage 456E52-1]|nr:winged helix-turn-helix DNA-binding domainprotein [Vibrio phage 456E52-1]
MQRVLLVALIVALFIVALVKQKEQTFQHGLISKGIIVDIAKYKKIKAAYEKTNKSIIELVDTTNELDPNCSLFGDILLDLDGVQSLLEMQEKLADMEKGFNREFMRLQKSKLIENQRLLLSPEKAEKQLEIGESGLTEAEMKSSVSSLLSAREK